MILIQFTMKYYNNTFISIINVTTDFHLFILQINHDNFIMQFLGKQQLKVQM